MSRLFFAVLVAGAFALAPVASADVPDCDCTLVDPYLFACPGADGDAGHGPGSECEWTVTLYTEDCAAPMVGFDCLRIRIDGVDPDSMFVSAEESADFPYVYPAGPTDGSGEAHFYFRGTILNLEQGSDVPYLQVCGCADESLPCLRGPDYNTNGDVGLSDFVVFASAFAFCPPEPTGFQFYTVYTGHCAPCPGPGLADFVIFARHFGHAGPPAIL